MSQDLPDNYLEEVPEDIDMSQEEWEELGYHGQYHHAERDKEEHERQRKERREKKRYWINRIKAELGCKNCGEDERVCLCYHHTNPEEKEFELSDAAGIDLGKEKIKEELQKCEVLCANCHRKVHAGVLDIDRKI